MNHTLLLMVFTLLSCSCCLVSSSVRNISEFITYYEPVWINTVMYAQATGDLQPVQVTFYAFNRTFTMSLIFGQISAVTPNAQIEMQEEGGKVVRLSARSFLSRMVEGKLKEDPISKVYGTFADGILDVVINTNNTTYFIEPAEKYFQGHMQFKSFMYRSEDVDISPFFCPSSEGKVCEQPFRRSYIVGPYLSETLPVPEELKQNPIKREQSTPPSTENSVTRSKEDEIAIVPRRGEVCLLKLVADHLFFQTVGKRNFRTTTEEMVKLVMEASDIFSKTTFPVSGKNQTNIISLQVKNIYIHKSKNEPNYRFYDERLPADAFLQRLSEYSFDEYCLGVGFTFRNFKRHVLGLAYLADPEPNGTLGGICQLRKFIPFRLKSMSYNAAFVSVGSRGQPLPKMVSVLSLAHEIGHSFGAQHDPESDKACNPTIRGSFLMSSKAVTGAKSNNLKFSPCSKKEIGLVYERKSINCFQPSVPVCGNGIAEDFEECDCGHAFQCAETDSCCTPMGGVGKDAECTYRRQEGKKCSPVKDPCCTSACQVVSAESRKMCNDIGSCTIESYCDGESAQCPGSPKKEDWELCRDRTGVCIEGYCEMHVCSLRYSMSECECAEPEFMCLRCCRVNTSSCRPAHELGILGISGLSILRPKGSACNKGSHKVCSNIGECVDPFISQRDIFLPDHQKKKTRSSSSKVSDTFIIILILLLVALIFVLCICILCWVKPFRILERRKEASRYGQQRNDICWCR